jgi:hypothetical protein
MGGMNKEELEGSPIFFRTDSCFLVLNFKLGEWYCKKVASSTFNPPAPWKFVRDYGYSSGKFVRCRRALATLGEIPHRAPTKIMNIS